VYALPILKPHRAPRVDPRSARVSLTDLCDLACIYCRPHKKDGYLERRLGLEAWRSMLRGLFEAGVRRLRVTGGEPLLHPEVVAFVRAVRELPFEDVALTTNATRLEALAAPLREAGLMRLNVSLDTLDPARFFRMTRGGRLATVLRGVDAAVRAGFEELKLNVVVVRGENDDELCDLVHFAWDRGMVPRFLEVMPIGEGQNLTDRVVPYGEMRAKVAHLLEDAPPVKEQDRGPAKYTPARSGGPFAGNKIGFITGTSDTFCSGCDRLRVASDGLLRPCLATNDGLSAAREAERHDAAAVADRVHQAWRQKPDGDAWKGCTEATARDVSIRKIGG
jgi:cyclic pyranopterin phosphate synthase